jgi:hypothetical protein
MAVVDQGSRRHNRERIKDEIAILAPKAYVSA